MLVYKYSQREPTQPALYNHFTGNKQCNSNSPSASALTAAVAKILDIKAADIKNINSYSRSTYHVQLTAGGVTIIDSKLIQKTLKKTATPDYGKMTVRELRAIASAKRLAGYSKLKKAELINILIDGYRPIANMSST